ncbi:MAG: adhesion lipoprotein, partial [Phototrophicales bacterium]
EFTVLLTAVQAADPAVLEALSDPEAELTVFAPTDAAFGALIEALGEEAFNGIVADTETLTNILLYHVVDGVVGSYDVLDMLGDMTESFDVTMLNGDTATISVTEDGVFINDAQIIVTDIDAANGIIHVIDAVIVPPAGE